MISSGQTSVGTVATLVDTSSTNPFRLMVHNNDNTDTVYLGGAGVTTSTGMTVAKSERVEFVLYPGERLFAVSSKDGHVLSWFKQEQ